MKNRPPPLQTPVTAPGQEDYFQAQDHSLTHAQQTIEQEAKPVVLSLSIRRIFTGWIEVG